MTRLPDSSLHILIVIYSLRGGGAERVAVDLSREWLQAGHRVTLVSRMDDSHDAYALAPGVKRIILDHDAASRATGAWHGLVALIRRIARLRAIIRQECPDIVLGMMSTSSMLAILAARGLPCKVIATEHTHPPAQRMGRLWRWLRRKTYPHAAAVVALTRDTASWLREQIPGAQLAVIPNAVHWPLPMTDAGRAEVHASRQNLLLGVGRLHPIKGFDVLVEAFARVADRHPDWCLTILGEGPQRRTLEQQIDHHGLQDRISLPGRTDHVGDWYARAQLYVLSSHTEGLSNTLLEAMASGCPVVAFDCETGPREIIRPDLDGRMVLPVGDAAALADALDTLMASPELRAQFSEQAIDVRERFAMPRILVQWQALFDQVLKRRASGGKV